jgi:hypothetical protein
VRGLGGSLAVQHVRLHVEKSASNEVDYSKFAFGASCWPSRRFPPMIATLMGVGPTGEDRSQRRLGSLTLKDEETCEYNP